MGAGLAMSSGDIAFKVSVCVSVSVYFNHFWKIYFYVGLAPLLNAVSFLY
jgi:hypothetical protein